MQCYKCDSSMVDRKSQYGIFWVCQCGVKLDQKLLQTIVNKHFSGDSDAEGMPSQEAQIAARMHEHATERAHAELNRMLIKKGLPTLEQEHAAMVSAIPGFGNNRWQDINAPVGEEKTQAQNDRADYWAPRTAKMFILKPLPYDKHARTNERADRDSRVNPDMVEA